MYCSKSKTGGSQENAFLRELCVTPLLTAQEEHELSEAMAGGDRDARARLIKSNLRLVVKLAREHLGRGMPLEDLVGEGNLGLVRAADSFEARFGVRFTTFAG